MEPVLGRLNTARGQPAEALVREIMSVLEQETSRVYRLIRHVASGFIEANQHDPIARPVIRHLQTIMGRDPANPGRLTLAAEDFTIRCMLALVRDLSQRLVQRDITLNDLWDVFSSGPGAEIVGDLMFAPFISR